MPRDPRRSYARSALPGDPRRAQSQPSAPVVQPEGVEDHRMIAAHWNAGPDGAEQAAMRPNGWVAEYAWRVEAVYLDIVKADLARGESMLARYP